VNQDFDALFLAARPRVFRMLARYVGIDDAEDVLQEAALAAWRNFDNWQQTSRFETWLWTIAKRLAWRQRRQSWGSPDNIDLETLTAPVAGCPVLLAEIHAAVARLPEHYRGAFVLCDVLGFSYEEIAGVLRIELGTVRSRIKRARAALQLALA
jgi:RNA polymerase sigma-70 factor, ECF subfamily